MSDSSFFNPKNLLLKFVFPVLILAGAGGGVWALMSGGNQATVEEDVEEKAWAVFGLTVHSQTVAPEVNLYGTVKAGQPHQLTADTNGKLVSLAVKPGQRVTKGQSLGQIDPFDSQLQVDQLQADLVDVRSQIQQEQRQLTLDKELAKIESRLVASAERRFEKEQNIRKQNLTSDLAVEQTQQQLENLRMQALQTQHRIDGHPGRLQRLQAQEKRVLLGLESAQRKLSGTEITAPGAGSINNLAVVNGQLVAQGQLLMELFLGDDLEVEVLLPTGIVEQIQSGRLLLSEITGQVKLGQEWLPATFDRLSSVVDSGMAGQRAVFALATKPQLLPPGTAVDMVLATRAIGEVFLVPEQAIYDGKRLYRVDQESRIQSVDVALLGKKRVAGDEEWWIISSPSIQSGDQVMLSRLGNAISGLKVEVYEQPLSNSQLIGASEQSTEVQISEELTQ